MPIPQHDINVPLLVSGPGIGSGTTVDFLVGNYDLPLTWAALAGATVPPVPPNNYSGVPDGKSLVPLLLATSAGDVQRLAEAAPRSYTLQVQVQVQVQANAQPFICQSTLLPPLVASVHTTTITTTITTITATIAATITATITTRLLLLSDSRRATRVVRQGMERGLRAATLYGPLFAPAMGTLLVHGG